MDNVFRPHQKHMHLYIDGIFIASKTEEEHLKHLADFQATVLAHGIVLSEKKSKIFQTQVEFLGLIIDYEGMQMRPYISTKILEFPNKLHTRKEIQSFLGCCNYTSSFIPQLSALRKPLQSLLKNNSIGAWTEDCSKVVKELKILCAKLPKLNFLKTPEKLSLH